MLVASIAAVVMGLQGHASVLLRVVGNEIVGNSKRVHLRGLDVCGMEWNGQGENVVRSVPIAFDDWKANIVRLPLCEDRWFGKTPDSPGEGAPYRKMVDQVVQLANARGKYVLLDLHWSDGDHWGQDIGQHKMPDQNSIAFWKDCAARYKNDPAVLFDLYNEPFESSWTVWHNGGQITEQFQGRSLTYRAVGMQALVDVIRAAGAKNVIVAGGLGYASQLDFGDDIKLKDPGGRGIVYVSHFYPGWENIASWERRIVAFRARHLPLIVSEFGAEPGQGPAQEASHRVTGVLKKLREYDLDWIAWSFHPAAGPCLISDWNYTPTTYFGIYVKAALEGRDVPIAPRAKSGPDMKVFVDSLTDPWQNWGNAKVDPASTTVVHTGQKSMRLEMADGQRLQLGRVPFDGNAYQAVSLWLNGGTAGGQRLTLQASVMDEVQKEAFELPPLKPNEWTHVVVPFSSLGIEGKEDIKSFILRPSNGAVPEFFMDDVVIQGKL